MTFECDYNEGAHPEVLRRLMETNMEQLPGYGADHYTEEAKEKIRRVIGCSKAEIYFLVGGTQTNQVVIDTCLNSYEGVISAKTGHVNCHEAGAIEYTGHKVMELPQYDGKLKAEDVETFAAAFFGDANHEHMVFPGMVYISHPTEYGTLYTKEELSRLRAVCDRYRLKLFLDGARLGYGLMSRRTDVTIRDIAALTDVFYIGGTKVGALLGEAVVFPGGAAAVPPHYVTRIKQHGALLAKGRVTGVQFDALFTDDLYFRISKNAIDQAERLRKVFRDRGYRFFIDSPTNQQFFILEDAEFAAISQKAGCEFWEKYDENHTVVRFATSWATTAEAIDRLAEILDSVK